jgi:hypothetical protein
LLAFAPSQITPAHGRAGAVGPNAHHLTSLGLRQRALALSPAIHHWSHLADQALHLAGIDLQTRVGEQILAGRLIAAC